MHKHNFKLEKGFLWCECGKSEPINHKCILEDYKEPYLVNRLGRTQEVQTQKCTVCGILKTFNLTVGDYN